MTTTPERDEAKPYTVWVFDHDECGGQTSLGDTEPGQTERCEECGAEVEMIR